mgnify:FL=1
MASYLEHMAIRVRDLEWHIRFFEEVFGMPVKKRMGEAPNRKVWLEGGIQLNETTEFDGPEGRADHLGIMTDDVEGALDRAYARGVREMKQGKNWIELPDGLCIEVIID